MTQRSSSSGSRSTQIGNVSNSQVVVGDHNVTISKQASASNSAEDVDVRAELLAIRTLLEQLHTRDRKKIDNALDEAEDDAQLDEPRPDEVGKALDRAIEYGTKAKNFADVVEKLRPHLENVGTWLGTVGPHIAGVLVG